MMWVVLMSHAGVAAAQRNAATSTLPAYRGPRAAGRAYPLFAHAWQRAHLPGAQDVAGLRERLAQGEEGEEKLAASRAGRALPFGKVAALAQALPPPDAPRRRRSRAP